MPLQVPSVDNRNYQQFLEEALARIPVHTPEWTNFNKSDPGVTIIEVFAFLAESLAYRSNLIPERNRYKFLKMLQIPLDPGSSARGFVTINNERGEPRVITLDGGLEVRAGSAPFRTGMGLSVLPIEAQVFYKHKIDVSSPETLRYYRELYASYMGVQPLNATDPLLYETRSMPSFSSGGIDLGKDTIDHSLWIALMLRPGDKHADRKEAIRQALAHSVLSLGILPAAVEDTTRRLDPLGNDSAETGAQLHYLIPDLSEGSMLPTNLAERLPRYMALSPRPTENVLVRPGIVQLELPRAELIGMWENLDPLEMGVGEFPPTLEDTALNDRLITWLCIAAPAGVQARILWVGANTTSVSQQAHVANELLGTGTGEPDQVFSLSRTPVIPKSISLSVMVDRKSETWTCIDDLFAAEPEVPVADKRLPPAGPYTSSSVAARPATPNASRPATNPSKVFTVDYESGQVRFGWGKQGARPPFGAVLRADYDYGMGERGNVGIDAITSAPGLPTGLKVTNPVPTWGGTRPQSVQDGERLVSSYVQHRDRLVTVEDFVTIVGQTPGVDVGRVEVLPAYSPELGPNTPGDAPGAVTLMVIPRNDPQHPNAPVGDQRFLDAICDYLKPRRLVTTELYLCPPTYRPIWVSIGIDIAPRTSLGQVTEAVKRALYQFLSPLPWPGSGQADEPSTLFVPPAQDIYKGWPLRKSVLRLEISAVANRTPGVLLVNDVVLIDDARIHRDEVPMHGLELPALAGLIVGVGQPLPDSNIPGFGGISAPATTTYAPVPAIPEECD